MKTTQKRSIRARLVVRNVVLAGLKKFARFVHETIFQRTLRNNRLVF